MYIRTSSFVLLACNSTRVCDPKCNSSVFISDFLCQVLEQKIKLALDGLLMIHGIKSKSQSANRSSVTSCYPMNIAKFAQCTLTPVLGQKVYCLNQSTSEIFVFTLTCTFQTSKESTIEISTVRVNQLFMTFVKIQRFKILYLR